MIQGAQAPRVRIRVAAKLAVCLVASLAAFFCLFGYISLREQTRHSEELILQSADRVSDIILRSTQYQMMHNDREALYQAITDIGREPGIRRIRIFNKEGRISVSTDAGEVNHIVDKRAEACYACHAQEQPLTKLDRPDRARIFRDENGDRLLAVIRPIENRPECSNAACHAHKASQRVLGVVDANLSLAAVDAQAGQHRARLIQWALTAMVLASVLSVLFVVVVVHRPVKELIAGTHRVADGDLDYRLPVRTEDEMGDLAQSFNKMTAQLSEAHGEITGWARTLEDRVEKKTAELQQAHATLLRTEKLAGIGKLAATVAHEVNNPLFGILTYARLTAKAVGAQEIDPAVKKEALDHLGIIEHESRRCGELMRNLLTFARQTPSQKSVVNVNEIVGRAVSLIRHKLEIQQVEIAQELEPDLPPVEGDGNQIQQVVLVLVVNAGEAMPNGGRLTIATRLDEGGQMALSVSDTGGGIPAEVLPNIFDPFFTTKEDQQRTGLGLAVARSIVEQHGGTIEAASRPGEGARFTVTLPLESKAAAAGEA